MKLLYILFFILLGNNISPNKAHGLKAEKIIGGIPVAVGWFKYVVALMFKSAGMPDQNPCTGTIIDQWHIITAAHCFYDKQMETYRHAYFYILVALVNIRLASNSTRRIQVDFVIMPNYYQSTLVDTYFTRGDLAIVKLKEELGLPNSQNTIKKLNIPQQRLRKEYTTIFYVVGYGWHEINLLPEEWNGEIESLQTGWTDGKLRYAKAVKISRTECEIIIKDKLAEGNFCARIIPDNPSTRMGICQNDSGSPLTHFNYLNGIAINGFIECDEDKMPGIYIDVLYYKNFIENALKGNRTSDMRAVQLVVDKQGEFRFEEV